MDVGSQNFSDVVSQQLVSDVVTACVEADSQERLADSRVVDWRGVGSSYTNVKA